MICFYAKLARASQALRLHRFSFWAAYRAGFFASPPYRYASLAEAGEAAFLLGVARNVRVLDASSRDVSDAAFRAAFYAPGLPPVASGRSVCPR